MNTKITTYFTIYGIFSINFFFISKFSLFNCSNKMLRILLLVVITDKSSNKSVAVSFIRIHTAQKSSCCVCVKVFNVLNELDNSKGIQLSLLLKMI